MTISSVTANAGSAPSANVQRNALGQADFIRLMTTQMKMQDPTDPVDNKEMIAQMAQFSSLSGIENVNATLKAMSAQLDALIAAQTPKTTA
ncbi:MAG: flagellar biosynthesis protein FlgD [Proteobacteria bacterium]|nr:flagellar biosynthesis protein FlgD [Pseudomonadota bacterium]